MIAAISGIVVRVSGQSALIKVGPVTLSVEIPAIQSAEFRRGDEVDLFTCLHFSSTTDQIRLFAFTSVTARDLFSTLITGSGVGPKVALALMELDIPGLVAAIRDSDEKVLTSVPGVGPKLAKKISLELSDKVGREFSAVTVGSLHGQPRHTNLDDALDAVVALGFSRVQAEQALSRAGIDDQQLVPAELIRKILAQLK